MATLEDVRREDREVRKEKFHSLPTPHFPLPTPHFPNLDKSAQKSEIMRAIASQI